MEPVLVEELDRGEEDAFDEGEARPDGWRRLSVQGGKRCGGAFIETAMDIDLSLIHI